MKNSNATIAVYSKATALIKVSTSKQDTQAASSSMRLSYSFRDSSVDTIDLDEFDAMIYDLSLVDNDIKLAVADIVHLKAQCENRPLILVGSRDALEVALNTPRMKLEVAHSIAMPMSASQLQFVLEAVIVKQGLSKLPKHKLTQVQAPRGMLATGRVGVGVGVVLTVVACLAFAISSLWVFSDSSTQTDEGNVRVEPLENVQPITVQDNKGFSKENASIEILAKLASLAIKQGRLAFPEKSNALDYFDQILEIDSFHQAAYQGRQETLKLLTGELYVAMSDEDFRQAEKLLEVLLNAEPFNDEYRRVDRALRSNGYVSNQDDVIDRSLKVRVVQVAKESAIQTSEQLWAINENRL